MNLSALNVAASSTIVTAALVLVTVQIDIYDLYWQLVRTLDSPYRGEPLRREVWDGRDALGRPVTGGVYLVQVVAGAMIERWRHEYNAVCPHSLLGYRPPAPETIAWGELPPTPHTHDGPILTFKVDRL